MKKIISFILAAILLLSFTACGQKTDNKNNDTTATEQTESVEKQTEEQTETDGKIVLTDITGREVELDKPAEKIVSCYYISTYAAIALGVEDRLVGIEKKADTRPIYAMAAPKLLELEAVGTLKELNTELVASLEPDLVLLPKKLSDYAGTLDELGIKYAVIHPEDLDSLKAMLKLIGDACGVADKADDLIKYYDEQFDMLADVTKDVQDRTTVYMASNSSYLATAPKDMYQSTLIELAGAVNASDSLEGGNWVDVSYEDILVMNPEVIVIPSKAEYTVEDILNDTNLSEAEAVKNERVYAMPDGLEEWDSPIPSAVLGSMWITSVVYEDLYSFEDFVDDAAEFYSEFYGVEIDKTLITK